MHNMSILQEICCYLVEFLPVLSDTPSEILKNIVNELILEVKAIKSKCDLSTNMIPESIVLNENANENINATECEVFNRETRHIEDITYLIDLFPTINSNSLEYLYMYMFNHNRIALADYLFDKVYSLEDTANNMNTTIDEYIDTIVKKLELEMSEQENDQIIKHKQINKSIVDKYGEIVIIPKYDENGNEIKSKLDPKLYLGLPVNDKKRIIQTNKWERIRFIENEIVTRSGEKVSGSEIYVL